MSWRAHACLVVVCGLLAVLLQMLTTSFLFVFIILHKRDAASIVPARDYQYYVDSCRLVYEPDRPVPVPWQ